MSRLSRVVVGILVVAILAAFVGGFFDEDALVIAATAVAGTVGAAYGLHRAIELGASRTDMALWFLSGGGMFAALPWLAGMIAGK